MRNIKELKGFPERTGGQFSLTANIRTERPSDGYRTPQLEAWCLRMNLDLRVL